MSNEIEGLDALTAKLQALGEAAAGSKTVAALQAGGLLIQNAVKDLAPVEFGDYRRSIHLEVTRQAGTESEVTIGTDKPQAKRLEYGFNGTDSLGRAYHQPAQPHFRPAFDETIDAAKREIIAALGDLVRGAT